MSVDYYSCDCCRDARYEEYVSECEECGRSLCDKCIENTEGQDWFDIINENGGSKIDNDELLNYIVKKYKLNLDEEKKSFVNKEDK